MIATVTDDDTAGVTNDPTTITLGEGEGATGTYTVVLNTQPTGDVTITPASDDAAAATVSPARMTFTTDNWKTPQTVTVTGVADDDATHESVPIRHTIEGFDYEGVPSTNVIATVTDDDPFAMVVVGTQTWSASNVSLVPEPSSSYTEGTHYWTTYGTAADNAHNDGYYYTWDAADNVCPSGWRLPSDKDWKDLEKSLGMSDFEADAFHRNRGTDQGTRLMVDGNSGFNAKLAGHRNPYTGYFVSRGDDTNLWSSSVSDVVSDAESDAESDGKAYRRYMHRVYTKVYRGVINKAFGFSVRCLKN